MTPPRTVRTLGGAWDVSFEILNPALATAKINGFRVSRDPTQRQISNVAPAFRVGGEAAYNSDTFEQIVVNGFSTGGDREIFEGGDKRFRHSDGNVATYMENYMTLDGFWEESDADQVATARQIVDFSTANGDYICVGVGKKIRAFDDATATWSTQGSFGKDATYLFSNDQYLFVATPGEAFWRWDGTAGGGWTQPGAGKDFNGFCIHNQTLYAFDGYQIIPCTTMAGATADWGTAITVGWSTTSISDMFSDGYYLYICKPEGFYYYDGSNVKQVIDATEIRSADNFRGGCAWHGALYLPRGLSLHKAMVSSSSRTVTEIPMSMYGSIGMERYGHGEPIRCFAGPDRIFVATDDEEGLYPTLLYHNDIGLHVAYRGASGDTMLAAGYSRLRDYLLINDGSTRVRWVSTNGIRPYPYYATSGWVSTPFYDAGYPDEYKAWRDVTIECEDVDADNTVALYYDADDAGWVLAGTISDEGKVTVMLGGTQGIVSARKIAFKLLLTRNPADDTVTPKVKWPMIIRGMVTPAATDGFEAVLIVDAEEPLYHEFGKAGDAYSYDGAMTFLEELKDTRYPVLYTDPNARRHMVKVTSLDVMPRILPDKTDRSAEVPVRMKSLYNGVEIQNILGLEVTATCSMTTFTWQTEQWGTGWSWGTRRFGV